jgi:hypothetical protein
VAAAETFVTGVPAAGPRLVCAVGDHRLPEHARRRLRDLPGGQAEVRAGPLEVDE